MGRITDVLVRSISKECPEIPGGQAVDDGDMLLFGHRGHVAERVVPSGGEPCTVERILVAFEGNCKRTVVRLCDLSAEEPLLPGHYSLNDCVRWSGPPQTLASGHELTT